MAEGHLSLRVVIGNAHAGRSAKNHHSIILSFYHSRVQTLAFFDTQKSRPQLTSSCQIEPEMNANLMRARQDLNSRPLALFHRLIEGQCSIHSELRARK